MKRTNKELDVILRDTFAAVRNEEVDSKTIEESAARVWSQLSAQSESATVETPLLIDNRIEGCAGFQSLLPAYLRGELSESRALLLKDHTHECIPCRRALKVARAAENGETVSVRRAIAPSRASVLRANVTASYPAWRWAVAAVLMIAIGLVGLPLLNRMPYSGAGATVHAANGTLYRISEHGLSAILPGETIELGESIRTARDANAVVRLRDGSLVEMKERSGLSVSENSNGTTLHLEGGNLIVQAAPQRQRHLYVETNDCLVSVTGTIFSVNNGTRGSRVSVIEGEVHVDRAGQAESVLHGGDQVTTSERLERVPVMQEIQWSRDRERYAQILESLRGMRRDLDAQVQRPGLRYSTRLLDAMPESTVLYAALPNLTATVADSYRLMQERVRDNAALREWWQDESTSRTNNQARLDEMINRVREFGTHLGGEIVVGAEMSAAGHPDIPFVIAELSNNGEGFRAYLENQMAQMGANANRNAPRVTIVDDPRAAAAGDTTQPIAHTLLHQNATNQSPNELFVWIRGDVVVAATRRDQLARIATNFEGGSTANAFTNTSFHARLASIYREGAGLIVAADLERILPTAIRQNRDRRTSARANSSNNESSNNAARQESVLQQLGVMDMRHVIVELKETNGRPVNRAVLSFNEQRRGMASWLATPGPMRALEFISPDANAVAAFVVKEPTALVDDLLNTIGTADPDVLRHLRETEAQHGLSLRQDFAQPLGGEFAFALDGPILPVPSWKMIVEVYDTTRLQTTLERTIERANEWARREGKQGFVWEHSEAGGQTFYALRSQDFGVSINYAYVNGYMIIAPTRALVERAIQLRDTGTTLLRAAAFQATLPADGQANFSAVFYQNLAPVVRPLMQRLGSTGANASEEAREYRRRLERLSVLPPMLAYAYANEDGQITFSAGSDEGPFGLNPGSFLGLPASFGIPQMLGGSERGSE
jgi:hypothetical protein